MAETGIKIDIFRKKTLEDFTAILSDPESRLECGSAAASVAAIAAALLARAAKLLHAEHENDGNTEQLAWYVKNTEILRGYMVNLIDEDVKCRGPLRRALKEGSEDRIEASRQASVSICLEIINMMGKCLELSAGLLPFLGSDAFPYVTECAELAYSASLAAGNYVLSMSRLSTDDTYRYVMKRENELTMQQQKDYLDRLRSAVIK